MKRLTQRTIKVAIKKGKQGLYYATSDDLRGLLVAGKSTVEVWSAVPKTIADMYHASGVEHVNLIRVGPNTWIARPE